MKSVQIVQIVLLVVTGMALVILIQMAGGKQVLAELTAKPPPAQQATSKVGVSVAGVGATGAAVTRLNSAATNSINRSMATIDAQH